MRSLLLHVNLFCCSYRNAKEVQGGRIKDFKQEFSIGLKCFLEASMTREPRSTTKICNGLKALTRLKITIESGDRWISNGSSHLKITASLRIQHSHFEFLILYSFEYAQCRV